MTNNKLYVIFDKETEAFWSHSAKIAWTKSNSAINAWQLHMNASAGDFHKQSRYVLIEVKPEEVVTMEKLNAKR